MPIIAPRWRAALETSGLTAGAVLGRLKAEHGITLSPGIFSRMLSGRQKRARLSVLTALEDILESGLGIQSFLLGDLPDSHITANKAFRELEQALIDTGVYEPWHSIALPRIIDPRHWARALFGAELKIPSGPRDTFQEHIAKALTALVKAVPTKSGGFDAKRIKRLLKYLYDGSGAPDRMIMEQLVPSPPGPATRKRATAIAAGKR